MKKTFIKQKTIILLLITFCTICYKFLKSVHATKQWNKFFISTGIIASLMLFFYLLFSENSTVLCVTFIILFGIYGIYWYNNLSLNTAKLNNLYWQQRQWWWQLDGWQFEQEVANIFRINGYHVKVTKGSGDGGVDIILNKDGKKYIVQCKHYQNPVPPEPIRALWGVKNDFNADGVILVASSGITKSGAKFIQGKPNFQVLNLDDIILLAQCDVTNKQSNETYLDKVKTKTTNYIRKIDI